MGEPKSLDQILVDAHGVAAEDDSALDPFALESRTPRANAAT